MKTRILRMAASLALIALAGACSPHVPTLSKITPTTTTHRDGPHQQFFDAIAKQCGKAFAGRLVSTDAADVDMANKTMVMHVSNCSANEIRIPFQVGEDRSRTWVLTRTRQGLRLKHDHRHLDGSEDAITQYGGYTTTEGSVTRQEFSVDLESIALFTANAMHVSNTNVWGVEIDANRFAYELRREGRLFRVEFDLTKPVATPAPAWGS